MPHPDDLFVAEWVLREKRLTREQLLGCLWALERERRERGTSRPLGVILTSNRLLPEKDLLRLISLKTQNQANPTESQKDDIGIAELLVAAGAASLDQIRECSAIQSAAKRPGRPSRRLSEILVERGYATAGQIERALTYPHYELYVCSRCGKKFSMVSSELGASSSCRKCGGDLLLSDPDSMKAEQHPPPAVEPARSVPLPQASAIAEQARLDRAAALYLRQKGLARRDVVRNAERTQLELSRFGFVVPLLEVLRRQGAIAPAALQDLERVDFAAVVDGPEWKAQALPGYIVTERIASGGYATIFAARKIFTQGVVALKILHYDRALDRIAVDRFRNEAALMIRFDHPNIVKAHEYGSVPPGLHFIAMEFVQGESVDQLLSRRGPFTADLAVEVTRQITAALAYMQKEGYIHRDIKPHNILLDDRRRARLCDLGFACVSGEGEPLGARPTTVGTPAYVSPEQARGETGLTVATDIYSLGLTLYAMLSGEHAFAGIGSEEIIAERFEEGVAKPDFTKIKAPPQVVALLMRMVNPDRSKRPRSYAQLTETLGR